MQCPSIIKTFNNYMGAVDLQDQLRGVYSVEKVLRTKFWPKKLFLGLLRITTTNAFILWRGPDKKKTHDMFMQELLQKMLVQGSDMPARRVSPRKVQHTVYAHMWVVCVCIFWWVGG